MRALFIDAQFMISLFLTPADELISYSRVISRPACVVIGKAPSTTNDFYLFNHTLSYLECLASDRVRDARRRGHIFTANLRGWHCRKERRRQKPTHGQLG